MSAHLQHCQVSTCQHYTDVACPGAMGQRAKPAARMGHSRGFGGKCGAARKLQRDGAKSTGGQCEPISNGEWKMVGLPSCPEQFLGLMQKG